MIELINVTKRYGTNKKVTALDRFSCNINQGEMVAVMGRSGSGKSTVLNILSGVDRLDEGTYQFMGEDISRKRGDAMTIFRRDNIGFVLQHFALIPEYTIYQNIALPLRLCGVSKKEIHEKVLRIAEDLGIKKHLKKYPCELSGGEAQRAAIARAVIIVSYALIYFLLPEFYKNHEANRYEKLADEIISELCSRNTTDSEADILTEFAQEYDANVVLYDNNGEILFDYIQGYTVTAEWNLNESSSDSSFSVNMGETSIDSEMIQFSKTFEYDDGTQILEIMFSLERLDEVKAVIIEIYPIAFVLCLVFAILAAVILSNLFSRPIRKLNDSVQKMASMDSDAYVEAGSQDEIGELSQNINLLYQKLRGTIDSLGQELAKNQDAENQKIDFLRTVSHELKNPLAAANALVEGMLYEIPPYNSNQTKYLMQCKQYLEKASDLARETLQFSKFTYTEDTANTNLKILISSIASEYMVLINVKQIEYIEIVPDELKVNINVGMFKRALSNLYSNAVNYTPQKGSIHVCAEKQIVDGSEKNILLIKNSCIPLSEEILEELFEQPYKHSAENTNSTGLGLYIVNQILNILHMRYWFVPSEESDGMIFKIVVD